MGGAVVDSHERLSDCRQTRCNGEHDIPLIRRKPGALRNGATFADMLEPSQQSQVIDECAPSGQGRLRVASHPLALHTYPPSLYR